MRTSVTMKLRRAAALGVLTAYSIALAVGSLTPVSRHSVLAGGAVRQTVDNLLHVPAYLGLTCLWGVALGLIRPEAAFRRDYLSGAGAALLYGGAMELGQLFVPGRTCSIDDFLLDLVGVALAAPLLWAWCRRAASRQGQPAA
jgi:VanZ family protein